MKSTRLLLLVVCLFAATSCISKIASIPSKLPIPSFGQERKPQATVDFYTQIKPMLETRCLACHNSSNAARGLNLETRNTANSTWNGGPVVIPEQADRSMLYQVTLYSDSANSPHSVPIAERMLLSTWINEGAFWPEGEVLRAR